MDKTSHGIDSRTLMRWGVVWAGVLTLLLAGCSGGSAPVADAETQLQAEVLRDGCVAHTLDLILTAIERTGPLAEIDSVEALLDRAAEQGFECDPYPGPGSDKLIRDRWTDLSGVEHTVTCWLSYQVGDVPVFDPLYADELFVRVETSAPHVSTYSEFRLRPVAGRGLVAEGAIVSTYAGDCKVSALFPEIVSIPFASQGDGLSGVLIQDGHVDLEIEAESGELSGAAVALNGRHALVAVHIDGYSVPGDLDLNR